MTDPTQIADPIEREVAARKARQAIRAQRAADGEIDRQIDQENQCPECGPDTEPARQYGHHPGFVRTPRTVPKGEPGGGRLGPVMVAEDRPCYTCNRPRWEAWQDGKLGRSPSKNANHR